MGVFATASVATTRVAMPTPSRCGQYQTYVNSRFIETPKGLLGNNQSASNNLYLVDEYPPVDLSKWGLKAFQNPPEVRPTDKNQPYPLTVEYTTPKTTSIDGCPLKVRSYNGKLVGPTLVARPGDTLYITLHNALPKETQAETMADVNQEITQADVGMVPNAFNVTNLHTHGLHVSPGSACPPGQPSCDPVKHPCLAASDNVLLTIQPANACNYVIHIPKDHPSGTFWYHAHVHGSTAVQVGSGMEGALIIEDRPNTMPSSLAAATARQKVFVLQSIAYEPSEDANGHPGTGPGEVAPAYNPNSFVDFFPGVWNGNETVNGQLDPVITMQPGEVQRWRFIDAAFRASIHLELQKCPEGLSTVACETRSKLGTQPAGVPQALHEIALDGLYTGRVDTWGVNRPGPLCGASYPDATQGITPSSQCPYIDLEPGYRSDVLFKAPAPGTYKLVDVRSGPHTSLLGVSEPDAVLATVVVKGSPLAMSVPTGQELEPLAYRPVDPSFPGFEPGNQLWTHVNGAPQYVSFALGYALPNNDPRNSFTVSSESNGANGVPFDDMNMKEIRKLVLGTTGKWKLMAPASESTCTTNCVAAADHVFHIHVNPFLYQRVGPTGKSEWAWKDTLLMPSGATIDTYSQYLDFAGKFVLHCHILDHEDLGMMQVVQVLPAGSMP